MIFLLRSIDYGKNWFSVTGLIASSATFSNVPARGNFHVIMATPAKATIKEMYIFDAGNIENVTSKASYVTPFHFDNTLPHPTNADKFIGLRYAKEDVRLASVASHSITKCSFLLPLPR